MTHLEATDRHNKIRIVFLSANKFGLKTLKKCREIYPNADYHVFTLSSSSKTIMYDGIDTDLFKLNCDKIHYVENINNSIEEVRNIKPDLMIMCGWRQIIDKELYTIPRLGTVGFHPTPLPLGRGPAPIINSILSGWSRSGVTMFYPDDGIDSGDIVGIEYFDILEDDYANDVYEKVINCGTILIERFLSRIINDNAPRKIQDESKATFFKKPMIRDNEIDLSTESPEKIYRKIRALSYPYLGAFIKIGNKKLIIEKAKLCTKIKNH